MKTNLPKPGPERFALLMQRFRHWLTYSVYGVANDQNRCLS